MILPGDIIQMKYDQFTSGQTIADTQDITDGNALISGLNIVMYPKRSNSIIVLEAHIHHSHSYVVSFGFIVNGTAAVSLSGNTNSSGSNVTQYHGTNDTGQCSVTSWKVSPTNPGAGTRMDIRVGATASWSGDDTSYTLYINDRGSQDMSSLSSITAYEIAQ